VTGAAGIITFTTVIVVALCWWAGTRGLEAKDLVSAQLDALKTGLGIGVGAGGAFGLYLAWRRQRSTEADLDNRERALAHQQQTAADTKAHQERVAAATEADAAARRITDLYTKAADQLGSDKAPVRLAGLYALERLAQDHPDQRQTIVNVLCAYLRMPYALLDLPEDDADPQLVDPHREHLQESQVRLTAQRILGDHLRPGHDSANPAATFWTDIDIDLTAATLIDFDLTGAVIRTARFEHAEFNGVTRFRTAQFTSNALFTGAQFRSAASFGGARFDCRADFVEAQFSGTAAFHEATFPEGVRFDGVRFNEGTDFAEVQFGHITMFTGVQFGGPALFGGVQFSGTVPSEVSPFLRTNNVPE
jgi:uncharacterized protein YjbI with pentapeptide repeats